MTSITYAGMDVHTTNFTLCCYTIEEDKPFALVQVKPEYGEILKYLDRIKKQRGSETSFVCGYEAGCLGYFLLDKSHFITARGRVHRRKTHPIRGSGFLLFGLRKYCRRALPPSARCR